MFSGDSDDTFQCRLEGPDPQDWQNCTSDSSQSYAGLHEGQYTFTVRAASNLAESLPRSWTIDHTDPGLPHDVVEEAVSSAGAIVSFLATDNLDPQPCPCL